MMENGGGSPSAANPDPEQPDMKLKSAEEVCPSSLAEHDEIPVEEALSMSSAETTPTKFDFHFPEEVWEIILNKLTEDDDRRNCCLAFPLFDQILTKSKPVWMFKEIFPILREKLDGRSEWTCRTICKQWWMDITDSVHKFNNPLYRLYDGLKMNNWYVFDSVEQISSFNVTADDRPLNPFFRRNIRIQNYFVDHTEFQRKVLDLLSIFGNLVWALDFAWQEEGSNECSGKQGCSSYHFLQQVLRKTPNLRNLVFREWSSGLFDGLKDEYFRVVSSGPSLPQISFLKSLRMNGLSKAEVPNPFINMLVLPYVSHLTSIWLDDGVLAQLVSHSLHISSLDSLDVRVSTKQELEKLLLLTAPLKSLTIRGPFSSSRDDSTIKTSTLIRVLQKFPLLTIVNIDDCFVESEVDFSQLTISTVGCLIFQNLSENGPPLSFNFLQTYKALHTLFVRLYLPRETYIGRDEGQDEVQFYKMLEDGQLYESNIWDFIPTFKNVIINWGGGSGSIKGNRRAFEEHQAK